MKQNDSFNVSYVLCRDPVIPAPSAASTLPPHTQTILCVQKANPGLWKLSCYLSRALSCSQVGAVTAHLGRACLVVMSEDSKSGITLLFQAMPGTVTLNKSLHQLLRYRLHCARRSWDALILSGARGYSAERHVFKYWINHSLDYYFFLSQMDALS